MLLLALRGIAKTMADPSITIKPFARKAAGSLAQRVLFVSVLLVGLPLLVHTFFLYHREYRENVDDTLLTMRSLAESRALILEQTIQNQELIIQALIEDLPAVPQDRQEFLKRAAQEYELDQLIDVDFMDHKAVCDDFLCHDPTFGPFLSQGDTFVFMNPHAQGRKHWLYVGKAIVASGQKTGALLAATSAKRLLKQLDFRDRPYPLRLSIIDETGTFLLSSKKETLHVQHFIPGSKPDTWMLKTEIGDYLAVKIPIEGTNYMLMLDVPEESIQNLQMKDYFFRIASMLFFIVVVGGGALLLFTHRISKPLRSLCFVMKRVSEGGTHMRFDADRMGFEINVLGQQLNQMLDALLTHQQEAERERFARERLAQELRIGHQIQASMLPTELVDYPSLDIAPGFIAAREVSGDFYDFFTLKDGRLLIAIADAADKGISACLFSLSFRSILRTAAAVLNDLPSIVQSANSILLRDTAASSFFITAWIGIYDPKTRELSYCSQGHPPAYLRKVNGELIELPAPGMALGLEAIYPKIEQIKLEVHDLLFLYTDGVIEATDPYQQLFGKARLKEFLVRCKKGSNHAFVEQLIEEIHLFCNGAPQSDDLTLLAIRSRSS